MRVTRKQAAANREKVLDVAGTLFRERGFDGIGVADIMKRAGLTHGGFYGQFASKDDLAAEATARVFGKAGWQERQTGKADPSFGDVVRGYLSPRHRDDPGTGCWLAARPWLRSARRSGSCSPRMIASIIARPLIPITSLMTLVSFRLASSRTFWMRNVCWATSRTNCFRVRVRSRSS